jgi:hypothetical protein
MDRTDALLIGVCQSGPKRKGCGEAVHCESDGSDPGAGDSTDRQARRHRVLAEVDDSHDTRSGTATQKVPYRELFEFAAARYERLANISVAHISNLRKQRLCREKRMVFTKTKPTPVSIGERRRPDPNRHPGYLRVDTVHQGDRDGAKGVYHINAVDEATQRQNRGSRAAYLRSVADGGAGSHAGAVPVPHSRLPLR